MSGDQFGQYAARKQASPFILNNHAVSSGSRRLESSSSRPASSNRPGGPQSGPRAVHHLRITKSARKYDERPPVSSATMGDDMSRIHGHASPTGVGTFRKSSASVPISGRQSNSLPFHYVHSRHGAFESVTARKSATQSPSYLQPSRGSDTANRRRTLMLPTPTNKPLVTKSRPSLVSLWRWEDEPRLAETKSIRKGTADSAPRSMDSARRRQTMSSTSGWGTASRGAYKSTSTKDLDRTRSYIGSGFRLRIEGHESSDDDMEIEQPSLNRMLAETRSARKSRISIDSNSRLKAMELGSSSDDDLGDKDTDGPSMPEGASSARKKQLFLDADTEVIELDEERSTSEPDIDELQPESDLDEEDDDNDNFLGDSIVRKRDRDANEVPSAALLDAIKPFLPTLTRRHLPFLMRNLRVGFQTRCRTSGIMTAPILNEQVTLQVKYQGGTGNNSFTITFDSWQCPICRLLGRFDTKQMLEKHLEWDHSEVDVIWLKVEDEHLVWRLILTFPERTVPDPVDEQLLSRFAYASIRPAPQVVAHPTRVSPTLSFLTLQDEDDGRSAPGSIGTTPPISRDPTPFPARLKQYRSPSPTPLSSVPDTYRGRSTTARSISRLPPRNRDPRGVTPPPPDDPLGPAARPPYLPAESEDGTIKIRYSCRPGGPKLYDLLGILPMDEFGVLSWAVLDREAEILESDDVRDEHKVMHALWARWIFLNRKAFIADFFDGTMEFVNAYWKMIHRAAGWSALRYWLLMLLANRYLTGSGVAQILKHYETLTKMDSWYE